MKNLLDPACRPDLLLPVLGILPLLAAGSPETAVVLGSVNLLALLVTGITIAALRNLLPVAIRLAAILLTAATAVALLHICLQTWFYDFSQSAGIYVPLIAVNCLLLGWAEEWALRQGVKSMLSFFLAGLCVLVIVTVIALIREYAGLSVLKQPAGAFLVAGLLAALWQFISHQQQPASAG